MANENLVKPIFFSVRKNKSYFMWNPYGNFFNFQHVCIEVIGEDSFALYNGSCLRVDKLGKKCLVSATRFRTLRDGIYILKGEAGGKYIFQLIKPLRRNA